MAGYPPFNQLKPVAEDIWIVDAPPIHLGGVTLPVRMTVIRLGNGAIWLHSPTEPDPLLLREIEALGPVRHLVAPSIGHWTFVETWQRLHPQAQVWAVPGLRERAQVGRSKLRIDHDLSVLAPVDWREDIEQCPILTPLVFREVAFLHCRALLFEPAAMGKNHALGSPRQQLFHRLPGALVLPALCWRSDRSAKAPAPANRSGGRR